MPDLKFGKVEMPQGANEPKKTGSTFGRTAFAPSISSAPKFDKNQAQIKQTLTYACFG
jgi:hypothetical protein